MNRRAALVALACGWDSLAPFSLGRAAAPSGEAVLAWGAAGCWTASHGSALQALPEPLAEGIAPAPTAQGLWLVNDQGLLRCWAPAGERTWQLRCTVAFATPAHALAASPDGRWVAAAHGEALSLVDAHGTVIKNFEGRDLTRERHGAASALFALPQRRSVVAAWPALGELWEISLAPDAPPIFDGLVHDYRMGEAIARPGYLGARRAPLGRPLPQFSFADEQVPWLAGVQGGEVVVVHLDVRRRIAALPVDAARPAAATLHRSASGPGPLRWWLPAGPEVHVFDTSRWLRVALHTLPGPVQQLQTVGDAVWALVGERGDGALWLLDDLAAGPWRRLSSVAGPIVALRAAPRRMQALALRSEPPALLRLDPQGAVLGSWALPAAAAWQGVAAWPIA